jgi:hypothetical protein
MLNTGMGRRAFLKIILPGALALPARYESAPTRPAPVRAAGTRTWIDQVSQMSYKSELRDQGLGNAHSRFGPLIRLNCSHYSNNDAQVRNRAAQCRKRDCSTE